MPAQSSREAAGSRTERSEASTPPPAGTDAEAVTSRNVDLRFGFRLLGRRYYADVRLGVERRASERLRAEGRTRLPVGAIAYGLAGSAALMLFGLACSAYLLKSALGIDLFRGDSALHPLFARMFE